MRYTTPLRYPGGKQKLAPFVRSIIRTNNLCDCTYIEPYAGGSGVALALLFEEIALDIYLNDLDLAVYSFWHSVLNETEALAKKIHDTPISMETWHKCRSVYSSKEQHSALELAFATFFLNRTNRSGIIRGGVIGGKNQTGEWKLDARFNKQDLIKRIKRVAAYRNRIHLYNLDAAFFIGVVAAPIQGKKFIYLDPPYFVEGRRLYRNHYQARDHKLIADLVRSNVCPNWIVSYDNVPEVHKAYEGALSVTYDLNHSANVHHFGTEVMFFADHLVIPLLPEPAEARD